MLTIKSRSHDYTVEHFNALSDALRAVTLPAQSHYLIDEAVAAHYPGDLDVITRGPRCLLVTASEKEKSFERLAPVFLALLQQGLKRTGNLVVIGGGVLQDIGAFVAAVLFRGIHWELIPTTLLAQADSCIGSKSSVNIGSYKNQIGTFYPPARVLLPAAVLGTLPWDEIRSGLGEVIKLQLLDSQAAFDELMSDLAAVRDQIPPAVLDKWVRRSLGVKQTYIERDEFDRGPRNLLNYGHTFGHAYESATGFAVPHGIAVTLGMLTATWISARRGLIVEDHYSRLKTDLALWHQPHGATLLAVDPERVLAAIRHDKKSTGDCVHCILTEGPGRMKKVVVNFQDELIPAVRHFLSTEI